MSDARPVTADKPPVDKPYAHEFTLPVQWGDQDTFQHVNNVIYARWVETARTEYWSTLTYFSQAAPILASLKIDFKAPLVYPDTVILRTSIRHLGRTSMTFVTEISSGRHRHIAAVGEAVIVLLDGRGGRPTPISPELRHEIEIREQQASFAHLR